ncbi:MAG: helix-turn-helix transcriptional regulator [Clostridia bacterium]|nr:helix-turn-helix transcriptional regulator [Clostridia bacterium]
MENQLAGHIRDYRRSLGLTQEQLAERLGITLGTVSKWERGSSEPDLGFIMDLAELFHVSVDALIGFSMRGADADEEAERIDALVGEAPFEVVEAECDNALRKFPNHFRTVLTAAYAFRRQGTMHKEEKRIRRALALYRHALALISQNRDPEISETVLRNEIAGCYSELKDYKKGCGGVPEEQPRRHQRCGHRADVDSGRKKAGGRHRVHGEGLYQPAQQFRHRHGGADPLRHAHGKLCPGHPGGGMGH